MAILELLATVVLASTSPGAMDHPQWRSTPTPEDIDRAYPAAARKAHVSGRVLLSCQGDEAGVISGCTVIREDPEGHGFGDAALTLTPKFHLWPKRGAGTFVVRIPIGFHPSE